MATSTCFSYCSSSTIQLSAASSEGHACGLPTACKWLLLMLNGYLRRLNMAGTSSATLALRLKRGSIFLYRNSRICKKSLVEGASSCFRLIWRSKQFSTRNSMRRCFAFCRKSLSLTLRGSSIALPAPPATIVERLPACAIDCRAPIELLRWVIIPPPIVDCLPMPILPGAREARGAIELRELRLFPETGARDLRILSSCEFHRTCAGKRR
mmetsp:Transcript_37093/g.54432  ORF Transcript_37093/g.54432 Transcript_37093/m.54432 type:complete len:211 (-) Transcript_37093:282-914(-)